MKEIVSKIEELELLEKSISVEQQNILERIVQLKNEKDNYFDEEQKYSENKSKLIETRKNIEILYYAVDILLGVDE